MTSPRCSAGPRVPVNERGVAHVLKRVAIGAGIAAGSAAATTGLASLSAATYFARKVLTPDRRRPDDTEVLEVRDDEVVLGLNPETVVPGRYGLWLAEDGNARLGDVVAIDETAGTVTRELLGVDAGVLEPGTGRWNPYFWGAPPDVSLGLPTRHVGVRGELGTLPAWVVPPQDGETGPRWAILVHGRGARREEALRAIRPLHEAGWTCMVPNYRNDDGVLAGPDGRYNLGLSEWRDIDAAARFAVRHGARELLVMGWSMGGAITLQFLDRSPYARIVSRVILDGPVIDWGDVLVHHGNLNRVPGPILGLSRVMMGREWGKRLVGVHDLLDVAQTDWVTRADELTHPMLLIHSADDEFVPVGPSRALAERRPDLVEYEEFRVARHCKEWNVDPQRWERVVRDFSA